MMTKTTKRIYGARLASILAKTLRENGIESPRGIGTDIPYILENAIRKVASDLHTKRGFFVESADNFNPEFKYPA